MMFILNLYDTYGLKCALFPDTQNGCSEVMCTLNDRSGAAHLSIHLSHGLHGKWFALLLGTVKL